MALRRSGRVSVKVMTPASELLRRGANGIAPPPPHSASADFDWNQPDLSKIALILRISLRFDLTNLRHFPHLGSFCGRCCGGEPGCRQVRPLCLEGYAFEASFDA